MQFKDRTIYEDSLKDYRDLKSAIDTSFKEGIAEGVLKVARKMIQAGVESALIQTVTGLSEQEIESLREA